VWGGKIRPSAYSASNGTKGFMNISQPAAKFDLASARFRGNSPLISSVWRLNNKSRYKDEVSMLTKIMMWVSIAIVLLALLELPVTSEPLLLEIVVCASGLLVMCRAVRSGQYLLATGFLPLSLAFSPISPIAISERAFLWLNWIGLAAFLVAVIALKTDLVLSMPSITNRTPRRESR